MQANDYVLLIIVFVTFTCFFLYTWFGHSVTGQAYRKYKASKEQQKATPPPVATMTVPFRRWLAQAPLSLCPTHTVSLSRVGRISVVVDTKNCEICAIK